MQVFYIGRLPSGLMARIYGDTDPRELPLYGQREAASLLRVPRGTLRGWLSESEGAHPVIRISDPEAGRLSFNNLVEGYVLRSLRTKHDVPIRAVRRAVRYAEQQLAIDRLLLRRELRWSGDLFWEELSELINLSESGQLAMREVVESYLNRVEWDEDTNLPTRLFPRVITAPNAKNVVIDPRIAFGQPTISGTGVATSIVARRVDAGETVGAVARDYGVSPSKVREALVYETAG